MYFASIRLAYLLGIEYSLFQLLLNLSYAFLLEYQFLKSSGSWYVVNKSILLCRFNLAIWSSNLKSKISALVVNIWNFISNPYSGFLLKWHLFKNTFFECTIDVPNIPKAHIIKVESISHKDLSGNSLTNITENLNHKLVEKISGRLIENISLNDFIGIFLKSSEYKDPVIPPILY